MKRILGLLLLIAMSYTTSFAQYYPEKTVITDIGSIALNNGEIRIETKGINGSDIYVVQITPHSPNSDLYISYKCAEYFIVKSDKELNCSFDYVVIRKRVKKLEEGITEKDLKLK